MEKKPYARIDFRNMNLEYDWTLCQLADVGDYVELFKNNVEDLDEIGFNIWRERGCVPEIEITVVFMSDKEFSKWFNKNVKA